jgi:hypothetical protein
VGREGCDQSHLIKDVVIFGKEEARRAIPLALCMGSEGTNPKTACNKTQCPPNGHRIGRYEAK